MSDQNNQAQEKATLGKQASDGQEASQLSPTFRADPFKPLGYHWQNLHRDFAPKPAGLTPRMAALVAAQGRPAV